MKKGFSLIELLISLVVISIIAAALTPIMTKKMSKSNMVVKVAAAKKGLQIYATPGTYAFDIPLNVNKLFLSGAGGGGGGAGASIVSKTATYTTNSTFTVPKGVNTVTIKIVGAGGGGGAANGVATGASCPSNEYRAMRGASDEKDLCYTKKAGATLSMEARGSIPACSILESGASCTGGRCVWKPYKADGSSSYYCATASSTGVTSCGEYLGVRSCHATGCLYHRVVYPAYGEYRLPDSQEMIKLAKFYKEWSRDIGASGVHLCVRNFFGDFNPADQALSWNEDTAIVPYCEHTPYCIGSYLNACQPYLILGSDTLLEWRCGGAGTPKISSNTGDSVAGNSRCVKTIQAYTPYSGSGGSSGAQLIKTISVLPGDTLTTTIGVGGAGGVYGTSKNNGITARTGNGMQGGTTQLVHKRGSTVLATYYVKGGFGGYGATTSTNGESVSSSAVTPSGTCYSNGNVSCTTASYSGNAGTSSIGGHGGKAGNEGSITNGGGSSGGYLYIDSTRGANVRATNEEIRLAKGQSATTPGYGGGGGLTPAWAAATSHFYQGGAGANGKIDISYSIALPGGGGGAGASAGTLAAGTNKEIELAVVSGDRLIVIIGKGGLGGSASIPGSDGTSTIIGENEIIFNSGKGGKIPTAAQISSSLGGNGGAGGALTLTSAIKSKTNLSSASASILDLYKGKDGIQGGVGKYYTSGSTTLISISATCPDHGFDGGLGGTTYLGYFGMGIGGGSYLRYDSSMGITPTGTSSCSVSSKDGGDAKPHAPAKNQFGGEGGGGGGVAPDNTTLGKGGDGADGYLRIRWGEE